MAQPGKAKEHVADLRAELKKYHKLAVKYAGMARLATLKGRFGSAKAYAKLVKDAHRKHRETRKKLIAEISKRGSKKLETVDDIENETAGLGDIGRELGEYADFGIELPIVGNVNPWVAAAVVVVALVLLSGGESKKRR